MLGPGKQNKMQPEMEEQKSSEDCRQCSWGTAASGLSMFTQLINCQHAPAVRKFSQ